MAKKKFEWKYGENETQKFYDCTVDGVYIYVFANKWNPDIWMGCYGNTMIHDKTANDRQRKKQGLTKGCHPSDLRVDTMLCSKDPEYMMKKVEHCFLNGKMEVSR